MDKTTDKITFSNLDDARKSTLLALYERLYDLPFGSNEFLKAAHSINQLERAMVDRYKADSDYAAKIEASQIDSNVKKELADIDSETKLAIASMDAEVRKKTLVCDLENKRHIAKEEVDIKREIAELEARIRKEMLEEENKIKRELAEEEAKNKAKEQNTTVLINVIETGSKILLIGTQLLVVMDELSKSRKFEETGVEASSAFKKIWSGFKPFKFS